MWSKFTLQASVNTVTRENQELQEWTREFNELIDYIQERVASCGDDQECIEDTRIVFQIRFRQLLVRLAEVSGITLIAQCFSLNMC